jgi:hypothetical protein
VEERAIIKERPVTELAAYLPGLLRTMRFGQASAHGRANLLQFNYLLSYGAIQIANERIPRIQPALLEDGLFSLASSILKVQIAGDYAEAKEMTNTYGMGDTVVTNRLAQICSKVPIDIRVSLSSLRALQ